MRLRRRAVELPPAVADAALEHAAPTTPPAPVARPAGAHASPSRAVCPNGSCPAASAFMNAALRERVGAVDALPEGGRPGDSPVRVRFRKGGMADRPLIRVVAKGRIEPPARGAVRRPAVPVILRRDERISDRSMAYHPSCLPAAAGLPCTSPDDGAQYTLASGFRAGLIEAAARERAMSPDTSALVGAVIGAAPCPPGRSSRARASSAAA